MSRTLQLPAFPMSRFITLLKRLQVIYLDRQGCPASQNSLCGLRFMYALLRLPSPLLYVRHIETPLNYSGRMSNSANESCSTKSDKRPRNRVQSRTEESEFQRTPRGKIPEIALWDRASGIGPSR